MTELLSPILLMGFMGAGKTTLGKHLQQVLNIPFVDLDTQIETITQKSIMSWMENEPAFRLIEAEILSAVLASTPKLIALGGGTPTNIYTNKLVFLSTTVFLNSPIDVCWQRVKSRRPLANDETSFKNLFASRLPTYLKSTHQIDGLNSLDEQVITMQTILNAI